MDFFTHIKKSVTPLNILLVMIVLASFLYSAGCLFESIGDSSLPRVPETYIEDQVRTSLETKKFHVPADETGSENNIFHPERRMIKRSILSLNKPQIILYGTFISQDIQIAYLEDLENPYVTSSGIQRQRALNMGDRISGFVIAAIYPEKVLLTRNNERIFVSISDKKKPREKKENSMAPAQPSPAMKTEKLKESQ